jgi:hypothetical protein
MVAALGIFALVTLFVARFAVSISHRSAFWTFHVLDVLYTLVFSIIIDGCRQMLFLFDAPGPRNP